MKYLGTGLLAGLLVLGQAFPAAAACTQQDMQGKWRLQIHRGNFYVLCLLSVNATGDVTSPQKCTFYDASAGKSALAPNSKLTMSSAATCTFNGTIYLNPMDPTELTLANGAMAMSKQTAFGVGKIGNIDFIFSLTKY